MANNNENNEKQKAGPGFLKMVIAGVVVFLLGAGIVFGALSMTGTLDAGNNGEQAEEEEEEQPVSTMDMGSMIVNLSDPTGSRYLKVGIVLEYPEDEEFTHELESKDHVITDTIINILRSKEVEEIRPLDNVPGLKNEIIRAINNEMTGGEIEKIYFTEFIIQ